MVVSMRITAPKWCRHKEMFRSYVVREDDIVEATCSNCGASAAGLDSTDPEWRRQTADDALMKIEKVGAVTEVPAP